MVEFFALLFALIFLLFALLPVLTFLRLGRISRELEDVASRVERLEAAFARSKESATFGETSSNARTNEPASYGEAASAAAVTPSESPESIGATGSVSASAGKQANDLVASPVRLESRDDRSDLESRIGGHGLLYTGVLVLLFGVSFFLKYAFDNKWIDETARVVLGTIAGIALVAGGLRLASRGLTVFGHALAGTGFAVLYLAIYAALNFYALIPPNLAFAGMVIVTLGAALLADRYRSQALAIIAVGGGFLTPFLVGGDEDAQLVLFSYDALLVLGTLLLSLRHHWLALNAISYPLTLLTLAAWASRHYDDDLWLRTLLFLTLFCVLFLIILRAIRRAPGVLARLVWLLLASGPLFYHMTAVIITARHPPAIHVYLIAFTAAGLWLTADPHRPWLRLLILAGGLVPLFGTLTLPDGLSWTVPNIVTIVAVAALHVLAIIDRVVRQEERLATADVIALHATGLGLFGLLYEALQPIYPDFRGGLAALLALGAIALWQWLQLRDRLAALNAAALAFTLAAVGVAVQFDGPAVVIGWGAEGAAAVLMGVRAPSIAFQYGGLLLWALAAVRLIERYSATPANFVAIFNARSLATIFLIVLAYVMASLFGRHVRVQSTITRTTLQIAASLLTLLWITQEIGSYWAVRYTTPQAYLYQHMMLSLAWGAYGAALIVIGMKWGYALARYIGMAVLGATALKVFFFDLWEIGGIYRVIGFIGFGVLLVLVSYLYQRRRSDGSDQSPPPPPPSQPPPSEPGLQPESAPPSTYT